MLDVGLDIPVSAELHSVLQIDIRVVRNLGQAGLSLFVVAFLYKAQFLTITLILFVNGLGSDSIATIDKDIVLCFAGKATLQIVFSDLRNSSNADETTYMVR